MLTIRKIRVASGDRAAARRTADYVLDAADSPESVSHARERPGAAGAAPRPAAVWFGTPAMLNRLGVEAGADVAPLALALALQGRATQTGERLRVEGMIQRDAFDERGQPLLDESGRRVRERVPGTKSVDLTFSAPKSVSVVWSQAAAPLRAAIETTMLSAAAAMLEHMTMAMPVVAHRRALAPARGFAAAGALHVLARTATGERVPSPQLHVHGVVVGVERFDGFYAAPELSGMYRRGAPLQGGAVARLRLAEGLADLGFAIEQSGRYFEISGVPDGLVRRMSGRARHVEARVAAYERARGKTLTNLERSVAALQTRLPKSRETPMEETVASWAQQAADFDFGPADVDRLRGAGDGAFSESFDARWERVSAARAARAVSGAGAQDAALLECAAGRLRLAEAVSALAPAGP